MRSLWGPRWHLRIESGRMQLELRRGVAVLARAEATWQAIEEIQTIMVGLAAEATLLSGSGGLCIEVARPLLQRRRLSGLPPVRRTVITAIVANQAGRFFRMGPGALVISVVRAGPDRHWVGVAVDEALLDALVDGATRAGLTIRQVIPAPEEGLAGADLLPPASRTARQLRRRRRAGRLLAAGLLVWVGLALGLTIRSVREAQVLQLAADSLRAPLDALAGLRREMGIAAAMLVAIDQAQAGRSVVARQLLLLSRSLPDSVVLTSLTLNETGAGRVTGLARRPLELVAELDRTHAVANPRLEGGTLKETIQGRPWERFTLAFGAEATR